jgi:hypothetical protein
MTILEIGFIAGSLISVCMIFCVKVINQLENSRCTRITNCCGTSCERDLSMVVESVPVDNIPPAPIITQPPRPQTPVPRPTLKVPTLKPTLQELRSRFENK